jgi:hypothetical protein
VKKLLAAAILLSAIASIAPSAQAASEVAIRARTAGDLANLCAAPSREPGADARINFCHGFAQGALDVDRKHAEEHKLFCFPANAPNRTVVMGEFVNWVRALPEHASQSAIDGLFHFFQERFPCK